MIWLGIIYSESSVCVCASARKNNSLSALILCWGFLLHMILSYLPYTLRRYAVNIKRIFVSCVPGVTRTHITYTNTCTQTQPGACARSAEEIPGGESGFMKSMKEAQTHIQKIKHSRHTEYVSMFQPHRDPRPEIESSGLLALAGDVCAMHTFECLSVCVGSVRKNPGIIIIKHIMHNKTIADNLYNIFHCLANHMAL